MQKVTVFPPRFAWGYKPAHAMFASGFSDIPTIKINEYQRREQQTMKTAEAIWDCKGL